MTFSAIPTYGYERVTNRSSLGARDSTASVRLGVVLLAMVVFVNDSVFRRPPHGVITQSDFQAFLKLAMCGACGLYGLFHLRRTASILLSGTGSLAVIFALWATATVPFAADTVYCLGACIALWCMLLFAAAIRIELDSRQIVLTVIASLLTYLALSWVFYYLVPVVGREEQILTGGEVVERFGGLNHPNGTGRQCALTIAMLLVAGVQRFARWKVLAIPLIFATVTLVRTDSRTAMLAGGAVVAVAALQSFRKSAFALVAFVLLPLAAAALAVVVLSGAIEVKTEDVLSTVSRSGDSEEIYSLTGRTQVWEYAIEKLTESPWIGYGFGCSRYVMENNFFPTHHAHNLWLNVMLSTGLIGGLVLLAQTGVLAGRAFSTPDPFPRLLLATVLVGGMADYVMFGPVPDSHTLLWLLAILWNANGAEQSCAPARFAGSNV